MVYIVSHTWPSRWVQPGIKNDIKVYSNCDEVELFNDIKSASLGKRKRNGIGTHFEWDSVLVSYNILYAEGYVNGKVVASDYVVLNNLPESPNFKKILPEKDTITNPQAGYQYIYRVNCGGPEYVDHNGNTWMADVAQKEMNTWGSHSWSDDYPNLPEYFASQRRTFDPIKGTSDWPLFQTFRYGRHKLQYEFPLPDGEYLVELYFAEPWYGTAVVNGEGWRLFDIAFNDSVVIKNLDLCKEAGHDQAIRKIVKSHVKGGRLIISFPKVQSGQAVISAIAIASAKTGIISAPSSQGLIRNLKVSEFNSQWNVQSWLDIGAKQYNNETASFTNLPQELFGSEWIRTSNVEGQHNISESQATFTLNEDAYVYIALDSRITAIPAWLTSWEPLKYTIESSLNGGSTFKLFRKMFLRNQLIELYNNGVSPESTAMYAVIVHKASILDQPAPPSRPSIMYEAEDAVYRKSLPQISVEGFEGKGYAAFSGQNADTIAWNIHVGVGDTYGLRFRYMNTTAGDIKAVIKVIASDGNILNQGSVYFSPSAKAEWDKVSTTTGTSINAGDYTIQLEIPNAKGLIIDNLKVQ
jgi:hypothetical protein